MHWLQKVVTNLMPPVIDQNKMCTFRDGHMQTTAGLSRLSTSNLVSSLDKASVGTALAAVEPEADCGVDLAAGGASPVMLEMTLPTHKCNPRAWRYAKQRGAGRSPTKAKTIPSALFAEGYQGQD